MPYYMAENGVCREMIRLSQVDFEDLKINIAHEIKIIEREDGINIEKNQIMDVK